MSDISITNRDGRGLEVTLICEPSDLGSLSRSGVIVLDGQRARQLAAACAELGVSMPDLEPSVPPLGEIAVPEIVNDQEP